MFDGKKKNKKKNYPFILKLSQLFKERFSLSFVTDKWDFRYWWIKGILLLKDTRKKKKTSVFDTRSICTIYSLILQCPTEVRKEL